MLEHEHPEVRALVVRERRGHDAVVPWEQVVTFEPTGVVVRAGDRAPAVEGDELRLARDVLDAQIVDIAGRRVRRVSDVELVRSERSLRAVAVDVGWVGIARRVGLGRLGRSPHRDLVDWSDLHMVSPRGHALQLRTTSAALHRLSPGELSELAARLPPQRAAEALHAVGEDRAAAAVSIVRPRLGGRLVGALPPEAATAVVAAMPVDDAVAVLRQLEPERRDALLADVPPARREALERLLAYPAGTAGGLMTTDIRTAHVTEPREEVLRRLREDPPALEGLFTVLLLDDAGRLAGVLPPSALIRGSTRPVEVPAVTADTSVERVAELFARHDLVAVPVVDGEQRPVGLVAVDDVLEEMLAARLPQHRRRYRRPFRKHRAAR
ncbi:MAG: magnesium transporter MgtE N-terminal domain-containing protein [Solirubrobacteraceae bacterium]